ncbi:hypothetical protein QYE76_051760 [Lolium multiflorum]|uniref:Uncharacterized protein n=1 Tax=Lolium multiflorum TaxID=4521 RepID=A0AAD8SSP3_LOLMU|nr:hypothetical protein QYE76_051760 [Lolium multiflorum]
MAQLGAAQDLIEEKERLEREATNEIASLSQAHEEEQNLRMSLEASVIILEDSNNALISQLTKDRDHALGLVGELKKKKLLLEDDHKSLLEEVATLTKDFKSLESKYVTLSEMSDHPQEEACKEKEDEGTNSLCDELVDKVASLRRHNALLLEVNSLQEEALDEYYRLSKEKTSCCNHEEEISTLEKTKAKLLELNGKQQESLMECLRMSKEKVTCCDHEEEIASLKRSKAKLMVVKSMQEEALKEYFPLSRDRACCNHEGDVAKLESHKRLLMKMNSLQEEALMEHFRVNKAKEVQVFDITHPHPEHEDEVNRLKAKIDRLQIQVQYLEGVVEAKDGANEGSNSTFMKIPGNDRNGPIFTENSRGQKGKPGGPRSPHHRLARPGGGARRLIVRAPRPPPTLSSGLLNAFDLKTPGGSTIFPEDVQNSAAIAKLHLGIRNSVRHLPDGELEEIIAIITTDASPSTIHDSPIHV